MASLSIGEISRLLNVSRRTLRYYEELGIVQPKSRGSSNNYRYYDTNDFNRIKAVIMLKDSGLSLKEISETMGVNEFTRLDENNEDIFITGQELASKIHNKLLRQRDKMGLKLKLLRETMDNINRSLHNLEFCLGCEEPSSLENCAKCEEGCDDIVAAAQQGLKEKTQND